MSLPGGGVERYKHGAAAVHLLGGDKVYIIEFGGLSCSNRNTLATTTIIEMCK